MKESVSPAVAIGAIVAVLAVAAGAIFFAVKGHGQGSTQTIEAPPQAQAVMKPQGNTGMGGAAGGPAGGMGAGFSNVAPAGK